MFGFWIPFFVGVGEGGECVEGDGGRHGGEGPWDSALRILFVDDEVVLNLQHRKSRKIGKWEDEDKEVIKSPPPSLVEQKRKPLKRGSSPLYGCQPALDPLEAELGGVSLDGQGLAGLRWRLCRRAMAQFGRGGNLSWSLLHERRYVRR